MKVREKFPPREKKLRGEREEKESKSFGSKEFWKQKEELVREKEIKN
jgi:hypothetical protein